MAFNPPIAYLITWSTYGTRLHGDPRGSNDKDTTDRGDTFVPPSARYENLRRSQLKEPPFTMDAKHRGAVFRAIQQHAEYRQWKLFALSIRTNHVHMVVEAAGPPEEIMRQYKAYATRGLRHEKCIPGRKRVWTEGGSKKWLFTPAHVDNACDYVLCRQGPDLPME